MNCVWVNPTASYNPGTCSGCYNYNTYGVCTTSCNFIITQAACHTDPAARMWCTWSSQANLYPMCAGTQTYDCSQYTTNSTCVGDPQLRCQWTNSSSTCVDYSCNHWKSNQTLCNSIAGCSYTTTPCAGNVASCGSITGQPTCSAESGCAWVGSNPIITTTTTTTTTTTETPTTTTTETLTTTTTATTETTTTTSATTGTTTTTTQPYLFTFSNFACDSTTTTCSMSYNNGGSQSVVMVLYLLSNQQLQQEIIGTIAPGSGTFNAPPFSCSALASGQYNIMFQVFFASDTSYRNPIPGLSPTTAAVLACP